MLSQQQRDADGRAVQSGINAHSRALLISGREEKQLESKRGRSQTNNENPCPVSPRGKPQGVKEENEWGYEGMKGQDL